MVGFLVENCPAVDMVVVVPLEVGERGRTGVWLLLLVSLAGVDVDVVDWIRTAYRNDVIESSGCYPTVCKEAKSTK